MIIDFEKIAEAHIEGFKGGEGKLDTRNYVDDRARIMYSTLRPGARAKRGVHDAGAVIDVVARVEFALASLEALDMGLGYFLKVYDHTIVMFVI